MAKRNHTKLHEWQTKAKNGGTCEKCQKEVKYLTVDHIVPISFLDMFDETGVAKYNDEDNFMLLCSPCNVFKGSRIDRNNPKTKEIILKYL